MVYRTQSCKVLSLSDAVCRALRWIDNVEEGAMIEQYGYTKKSLMFHPAILQIDLDETCIIVNRIMKWEHRKMRVSNSMGEMFLYKVRRR